MRYRTKKAMKKDPTTIFDKTIAKKLDTKTTVKKWSYIIKKLTLSLQVNV
tara:strand:+ start:412 stop:561 length:150 start_codon:yes stop_codon:yes gene_type:complete